MSQIIIISNNILSAKTMLYTSEECDPNDFYSEQTHDHDKAANVQNIFKYCTASFVLCFGPFIIVTPFCVKRLNVLTRKIIAMIVLSDTLKLAVDLILVFRHKVYEASTEKHFFECSLVAVIQNSTPVWSMTWNDCVASKILKQYFQSFRSWFLIHSVK